MTDNLIVLAIAVALLGLGVWLHRLTERWHRDNPPDLPDAATRKGRPEGERFTEAGEIRVSLGAGKSIPESHYADYVRYINGES